MVIRKYVPEQGDLVWFDFSPYRGHEQGGRRPAVVLSPKAYNAKTGLALMCPITSKRKGFSTEIDLPVDCLIGGVILADQLRSQDWQDRHTDFIGVVDAGTFEAVTEILRTLVRFDR